MSTSPHSNLVRLSPLEVGDLPSHPDLPDVDTDRPELKAFMLQFLEDGAKFASPEAVEANFQPHSTKQQPVSGASVPVNALTYSIPATALNTIDWSSSNDKSKVARTKPRSIPAEYWVARRSYHANVSSKDEARPGNASWDEFVFGLRDDHSQREESFTPTLYHAHKVLDWNQYLNKIEDEVGMLGGRFYTMTLSLFEMCHKIPSPLAPRCFPVLVATASLSPSCFIAVTVPVNLGNKVSGVLYSSSKNLTKGRDEQSRKEVVLGVYAAVEMVTFDESRDANKQIEWFMATASDAKGSLPMFVQKSTMPTQVVKDVGFFLNWIKTVDEDEIPKQPAPGKVVASSS